MTEPKLQRAPVVRIFDRGDTTTLIAADGAVHRLDGDSAGMVRAILEFMSSAHTRSELLAHLESLSGGPIEDPAVVDQALSLLRTLGVLREPMALLNRSETPRNRVKIVLGLTGAVATMHAPSWVSLLLQRGFDVRVATTRRALKFVRREALETLTHNRVYSGVWDRDSAGSVPHINLAEWADLMLVCPASATTLSRIAGGNCQDLVSATAIATLAPVVLVPSMNPAMRVAPSVQRNLETLRDDGFAVVHSGLGHEIAHRPDARVPLLGPAPPFEEVLAVVQAVLATRKVSARAPSGASQWDELYHSNKPDQLPWHRAEVDRDVGEALEKTEKTARFLDIGTGTGTVAIEAANRGLRVTATDISHAAIDFARQRKGADAVTWLVDDVLATRIRAQFDVVHDRGCLHLLPVESHKLYVSVLTKLVSPGGSMWVKVHSTKLDADLGTHRFTEDEITALMSPGFELVSVRESTLPGPSNQEPQAMFAMFRRRK